MKTENMTRCVFIGVLLKGFSMILIWDMRKKVEIENILEPNSHLNYQVGISLCNFYMPFSSQLFFSIKMHLILEAFMRPLLCIFIFITSFILLQNFCSFLK